MQVIARVLVPNGLSPCSHLRPTDPRDGQDSERHCGFTTRASFNEGVGVRGCRAARCSAVREPWDHQRVIWAS